MATAKATKAWAELNDRQRLYLSTIFDFDQAAENDIKARRIRWEKVPPASEWRQVTYDIKLPREIAGYSSVQQVLRRAGQHDPGSGASLAALERRDLVAVTHDQVYVPLLDAHVPRVRVRLTTFGRAVARAGKGITTPASVPRGLMSRWSFRALALLYPAGEDGLVLHGPQTPSWNTLLHLRNRRSGSLIDEFAVHQATTVPEYRVRLTMAGRRHYAVHLACYRELFPDLDVPLPEPDPVAGAHAGLDDHRRRPPRHLVRDTDVPVLARLIQLEATGTCQLRRRITEEYQRIRQTVPAEVHAIPAGLLRGQVRELTGTEKSIQRLAEHSGGPLVEVIDAPNGPFHRDTHPTVPLVVLTEEGRAHYARHRDEYLRACPELNLPCPAPEEQDV